MSEYSETSQIATLFTRSGGVARVIAKGARRGTRVRFSPGLDLLEYGDVTYLPPRGETGLGTLRDWKQRDLFLGLRASRTALHVAVYAGELVSRLTEEMDPHPALFEGLVRLLSELAHTRGVAAAMRSLLNFQLDLSGEIGFRPLLDTCVVCGRVRAPTANTGHFSSQAGGALCRNCQSRFTENRRLPPGAPELASDTDTLAAWIDLMNYHLAQTAGRAMDTYPALAQVLVGNIAT